MSLDVDDIARPEPKRDRFGRYLATTRDGKQAPFTRATTIAKTIEDQYALTGWKMRMVASGLAGRNDLITSAQAHDPTEDRHLYDKLVQQALDAAASSSAATTGTALHRFTEDVDMGRKKVTDIPAQWRETIDLYQTTLARAGLEIHPDLVETVLLFDNYQIAGTCDRIVTTDTGRRLIADIKTSKNLNFGWLANGIQLAIYANHTATFDYGTGQRGQRIDVDTDVGLIIHLPSQGPEFGSCTIYEVDLVAAYEALLTSIEVRGLRKVSKAWGSIYEPGRPVDLETACTAWINQRIQTLVGNGPAVAELRKRWPAEVPKPFPMPATAEQINALAAVLDDVEAKYSIAFGPPRPGGKQQPTTNGATP